MQAGSTNMTIGRHITPTLKLVREIGKGGMGRVWAAENLVVHRDIKPANRSPHLRFWLMLDFSKVHGEVLRQVDTIISDSFGANSESPIVSMETTSWPANITIASWLKTRFSRDSAGLAYPR